MDLVVVVVANIYNPSTQEAEAGESLRPVWSAEQVLGLYRETLSSKLKEWMDGWRQAWWQIPVCM